MKSCVPRVAVPLLLASTVLLFAAPAGAMRTAGDRPVGPPAPLPVLAGHTTSVSSTHLLLKSMKVPSFSRQTGLACGACHFQFPQLTPFGRLFKLNGYTMTGLKTVQAGGDSTRQTLALSPIPGLSGMLVSSLSHVAKTPSGTQNGGAMLPQEASVFLAGAISPKIGAFLQYTYGGSEGTFGIDNIDVRFASRTQLASKDLIYGMTLNNNPTVQDVWNTVPAWGWPFMQSEQTPGSIAMPVLAGQFGQNVLGLGAYGLWNQTLYGEVSLYRTALQGTGLPLGDSASGVLERVAPYWRVAVQRDVGTGHFTIGTYGIDAHVFGQGVSGLADQYTDYAGDAQYESHVTGDRALIVRASVIRERRNLSAAFDAHSAESLHQNLTTFQARATFEPAVTSGLSVGVFSTTGTRDGTLYAPADVTGSANGKPETSGFMGEFVLNPWQNTRFGLQYTAFTKFNGAGTNYDGSGRRARDNNTLYLYTWLVF
ncbi:MAG: hypothetical protein U0163_13665 [Gemmatimonadaceae bacterium]